MINKRRLETLEAKKAKLEAEIEKENLRVEALLEQEISKLQEELASIKTYGGKKRTVAGADAGTKVVSPMTPELEAEILERFHRGETAHTIREAVHKSYYSIVGILAKNGLSFESRALPTGKKPVSMPNVSETEIAAVEELLKSISAEQIIKNYPDMRVPLICVLYKSNTSGVIAKLFADAGHEVGCSQSSIHHIVYRNGIYPESEWRKRINSGYTGDPTIETEILGRFHRNESLTDIRNATGKSYRVITKVLSKHGLSFEERGLHKKNLACNKGKERTVKIGDRYGDLEVIAQTIRAYSLCRNVRTGKEKQIKDQSLYTGNTTGTKSRRVQIGDRYGNWEVIDYAGVGRSLCRNVETAVEKVIPDHNLYSGASTGTRKLKKIGYN